MVNGEWGTQSLQFTFSSSESEGLKRA